MSTGYCYTNLVVLELETKHLRKNARAVLWVDSGRVHGLGHREYLVEALAPVHIGRDWRRRMPVLRRGCPWRTLQQSQEESRVGRQMHREDIQDDIQSAIWVQIEVPDKADELAPYRLHALL